MNHTEEARGRVELILSEMEVGRHKYQKRNVMAHAHFAIELLDRALAPKPTRLQRLKAWLVSDSWGKEPF